MEHRFFTMQNGYDIHVQIAGLRGGTPLLLHGYPSSHQLWRKCVPELAHHFLQEEKPELIVQQMLAFLNDKSTIEA